MLNGIYMMSDNFFENVYSEATREAIVEKINIVGPLVTNELVEADNLPDELESVDIILSGWGTPKFDANLLDRMPNLKVILYSGGTMKDILTDEVWNRNIRVSTANSINGIPVADYTLAAILFSLKNFWQMVRETKMNRTFTHAMLEDRITGIYKARVGIISISQIGKMVIEHLNKFNLDIVSYDPYVSQEEADKFNTEMVDLETLFATSDVVSLHTPLLPETEGMITGELLKSMKPNTTFINTARGAIVKENELIKVMKERDDLTALLDVTNPEPPVSDSPLYDLDNVILTPHLAGSVGNEKARLGDAMLAELTSYIADSKLSHEITKESYERMA